MYQIGLRLIYTGWIYNFWKGFSVITMTSWRGGGKSRCRRHRVRDTKSVEVWGGSIALPTAVLSLYRKFWTFITGNATFWCIYALLNKNVLVRMLYMRGQGPDGFAGTHWCFTQPTRMSSRMFVKMSCRHEITHLSNPAGGDLPLPSSAFTRSRNPEGALGARVPPGRGKHFGPNLQGLVVSASPGRARNQILEDIGGIVRECLTANVWKKRLTGQDIRMMIQGMIASLYVQRLWFVLLWLIRRDDDDDDDCRLA